LAKAVKYRVEFFSKEGTLCQVDFRYEGYTAGIVYYLDGGSKPFVLREFNTDDNLFKPIRPLLAEIQIVTNSSSVSIDDFLADQDTDIEVRFTYNSVIYWSGFVLQDDFQESYEDQNHILTITATEALGSLKDKSLTNNGAEILDMSTPLQFIEYCLQDTSKPLTNYTIVNNLYHTSMSTTLPDTSLSQAKLDPRTFEISPREYENCYTVLERINTSFNQTIFQYENRWYINRLEDLYTNGNIRGYDVISTVTTTFNRRFDIEVSENSEVKPIAPQMLRFINRKPKETIVRFNFERLAEVIKNSSFSRGAITATLPTQKEYEIDNWTLISGNPISYSTSADGTSVRIETYQSNVGPIIDNYITVPQTFNASTGNNQAIMSEPIDVNFGEKIRISAETKYNIEFTSGSAAFPQATFYVYLDGNAGTDYLLDENGQWKTLTSIWAVELPYKESDNIIAADWNTIEVEAEPLPDNGVLKVFLICPELPTIGNQVRYFKNFEFEILNRIDGFQVGLTAVECKFIKTNDIKFNNNYDLYISDFISESYKGLIYENDGTTPTDFEWYRFRYSGERQSFKKQNAISYWSHNRYDRDKVDASFYGLTWNDAGTARTIGLLNTIKLVDDLPNKIFYISNLKEIDFYNATWSCTIEEIWDESRDGAAGPNRLLTLNTRTGTYNNITTVPYNASTNVDFVVAANNLIIYQGAEPITESLTISLSGNFISYIGATPVLVEFYVKQNNTTIKTQAFTISGAAPFPFTVNLSPTGTYTINPNDQFEVSFDATEVGKDITSIQFTSGTFNVSSYNVPNTLNYDNYIEKYIYK
jgi:hypothetical protein